MVLLRTVFYLLFVIIGSQLETVEAGNGTSKHNGLSGAWFLLSETSITQTLDSLLNEKGSNVPLFSLPMIFFRRNLMHKFMKVLTRFSILLD